MYCVVRSTSVPSSPSRSLSVSVTDSVARKTLRLQGLNLTFTLLPADETAYHCQQLLMNIIIDLDDDDDAAAAAVMSFYAIS